MALVSTCHDFRSRYLTSAEIDDQLQRWATAHPELIQLKVIGQSRAGRPLTVALVGPRPEQTRPTVWVDGNMHASELCGSNVAMAIIEDTLALHLGVDIEPVLSPAVVARVRDVLLCVMPRMSPDGAERVLKGRGFVRSSDHDDRLATPPRWAPGDIDGDGHARLMRVADPAGDFVPLEGGEPAMRPRRVEDPPPYFKLYPEGTIVGDFDGVHIPDPQYLDAGSVDLNRNFPYDWHPEPAQAGAGRFPLSEPTSRAVVEFTSEHPEIFAWMNLHCFGGVVIHPPNDTPDKKADPDERALFAQLAAWTQEHAGYPSVTGFEFTYVEDEPLRGELMEYAYRQRGAIAWVVELWDIFERLGLPMPRRFVERYGRFDDDARRKLVAFDLAHNEGRMFAPWRSFQHPQLGPVEVGGFDPLIGLWNPPLPEIRGACRDQAAVLFRVAAMAPRLQLAAAAEADANGQSVIDVTVDNVGYLPTYVLPTAQKLRHVDPVELHLETLEGDVVVVAPASGRIVVGHLEGWGRGKDHSRHGVAFARSRGTGSHRRVVRLVCRGSGTVRVRARSLRTGEVSIDVDITAGAS